MSIFLPGDYGAKNFQAALSWHQEELRWVLVASKYFYGIFAWKLGISLNKSRTLFFRTP